MELGGTVVDVSELGPLQRNLADAERAAAIAAPRARIEAVKARKLQGEVTAIQTTLQGLQSQVLPLVEAMLWEKLATETVAYTTARATFIEQMDRTFSTAMALDELAKMRGSGRYAGGSTIVELQLPLVTGCPPLDYSLESHWRRVNAAGLALLKSLGLSN